MVVYIVHPDFADFNILLSNTMRLDIQITYFWIIWRIDTVHTEMPSDKSKVMKLQTNLFNADRLCKNVCLVFLL